MHNTQRLLSLGLALTLVVGIAGAVVPVLARDMAVFDLTQSSSPSGKTRPRVPALRVERFQKRIERRFNVSLPLPVLEDALATLRDLYRHTVTVSFAAEDGIEVAPWIISLQEHPLWIRAHVGMHFAYSVDPSRMRADLRDLMPGGLPHPVTAVLTDTTEDRGVAKAITDGIAKPGYTLDAAQLSEDLAKAFTELSPAIMIPLGRVDAPIINATGRDFGELRLLAQGRSNFEGSGVGRKNNVRRGLNREVNNTLVAPGEVFSFNTVLHDMRGAPWDLALGIFNGNELKMVPGGGICQVATTVYRGALMAGFPILERANHSLFVTYYEKHGVGIDATIFPKFQDLRFTNDTGHYLLIQSYTEGDEAYVNIYGTPDGRSVAMEGPYFSINAPDWLKVNGRPLRGNEIAWVRHVTAADGSVRDETIVSRYSGIPRSLPQRHASL